MFTAYQYFSILYDALHKKKIIPLNLNFYTVEVEGTRKNQRPTNIRMMSGYFHYNQQYLRSSSNIKLNQTNYGRCTINFY